MNTSAFGVEHVSKSMSKKKKAAISGGAVVGTGAATAGTIAGIKAYKNKAAKAAESKPRYHSTPLGFEPLDMEPLHVTPLNDGKRIIKLPEDLDLERLKAQRQQYEGHINHSVKNGAKKVWVKPKAFKVAQMLKY